MNIVRAGLLAVGLVLVFAGVAAAAGRGLPRETTARVIVAFKPEAALLRAQALSANAGKDQVAALAQRRADGLAARARVVLSAGRLLGRRAMVLRASGLDSDTLAARLSGHPDLLYAVPDRRRRIAAVPNDPLFSAGPASGKGPTVGQWYARAPDGVTRSAVNALGAWNYVTGSPSLVVAVLDTGVLAGHVDLAGVVLPGHDMVNDLDTANDGNGRDTDASDPGDWITAAEDSKVDGPFYQICGVADSSWHGTQVAGIIAGAADNGVGMAGIAHGVRILPVRVLGKCGGYDSDIIAGMYWAAGVDQPGLPASLTPARVLNLSLGGDGACSQAYVEAVASIAAPPYNALVVAAAGNSTGHAVGTPANCPGVIGVAGLRHAGSKVGFSDLGPEVGIAAPGGNCINIDAASPCLYPILTTSNSGTRGPVANGWIWTDAYNISVGTSFATPIVAGAAALVLSARPDLSPAEVIALLKRTARSFPSSGADNGANDPTPVAMCHAPNGTDQLQCYCTTSLCGAGMLDIGAAVLEAQRRVAAADSSQQLFDFAERGIYSAYFPAPAPVETQTSAPFSYRYYPGTGVYLGVVVQSDSAYVLDGVYVMGGSFGSAPLYAGQLTDFIVPRPH